MQANETHISLETAKLLKDCVVKSKFFFCLYDETDKDEGFVFSGPSHGYDWADYPGYGRREIQYPAYTRQEILREHAEEFFGKEHIKDIVGGDEPCDIGGKAFIYHSKRILFFLQVKKYEEADKYFRKNCVLIK